MILSYFPPIENFSMTLHSLLLGVVVKFVYICFAFFPLKSLMADSFDIKIEWPSSSFSFLHSGELKILSLAYLLIL